MDSSAYFTAITYTSLGLSVLGLILNTIFIYSIINSKKLLIIDNAFNLNIAIADVLICGFIMENNLLDIAAPGFRLGTSLKCNFNAVMLQFINSVPVVSLLAMVVYHYFRVVHEWRHVNQLHIVMSLCFIWLLCLSTALIPVFFIDNYFVLQPSKLWCGVDLVSSKLSHKVMGISLCSGYLVVLLVILWAYYGIWAKVHRVKESLSIFEHVNVRQLEMDIIHRGAVIFISFNLVWILLVVATFLIQGVICYTLATARWVAAPIDGLAIFLSRASPVVNAVVYLSLDKAYQDSFRKLWRSILSGD